MVYSVPDQVSSRVKKVIATAIAQHPSSFDQVGGVADTLVEIPELAYAVLLAHREIERERLEELNAF